MTRETLVALGCAIALTASAHAQTSHLGQDADNLVVLVEAPDANPPCGTSSMQGYSFYRMQPSGSISSTRFTVPVGYRLVVTDVSWQSLGIYNNSPLTSGKTVQLCLSISGSSDCAFRSEAKQVHDSLFVAGSQSLTAGFSVGEGKTLCASATETMQGGSWGIAANVFNVIVSGYLIAD